VEMVNGAPHQLAQLRRTDVFKGSVAPVSVWIKVVRLERAKIGEEPLSV
jgi:hypothetical protein